MQDTTTPATIKVWDPLIRIFHWLLAAAFFTAYLSAEESQTIHTLAGYLISGLIVGRLLWGFIGTPHARFKDFIVGPGQVMRYGKSLLQRRSPRYLGHNPAGAVMIVLLLLSLTIVACSGMITLGIEEHAGPLAGWVQSMGWHDDDVAEEIHEFFANFTLLLVFVHISGVIIESLLHRDNLIQAMITGRKRPQS